MFKIICLLSVLSLTACGKATPGAPGSPGMNGSNGVNGQPCTVTQTANGATISCPDGKSVTVNNGVNGINGTQITMVQLCPGYTPSYGSFPEFAICDANKLYGVYWDGKNAWLAEIVPGNYVSTSSDASCSFMVTSGCNVVKE